MNSSADKTIEYLASAKFIVGTTMECFNHCIEDFQRKELIPIEKHCMEGCMQIKFQTYSASANNRTKWCRNLGMFYAISG